MTDKMELLKRTKLFVLDMDGTFYLGNQILPGAADFLKAVEKAGKQYLFFTNNSSRSPRDYMAKLEKMEIVHVIDKRINPHSGINNAVYALKREGQDLS